MELFFQSLYYLQPHKMALTSVLLLLLSSSIASAAGSVCSQLPYALVLPLSKFPAAEQFCTSHYPVAPIRTTSTAPTKTATTTVATNTITTVVGTVVSKEAPHRFRSNENGSSPSYRPLQPQLQHRPPLRRTLPPSRQSLRQILPLSLLIVEPVVLS